MPTIQAAAAALAEVIARRLSFQFKVDGPLAQGVIYVTKTFTDETKALAAATRTAVRRSGDPAPVFVRTVAPVR